MLRNHSRKTEKIEMISNGHTEDFNVEDMFLELTLKKDENGYFYKSSSKGIDFKVLPDKIKAQIKAGAYKNVLYVPFSKYVENLTAYRVIKVDLSRIFNQSRYCSVEGIGVESPWRTNSRDFSIILCPYGKIIDLRRFLRKDEDYIVCSIEQDQTNGIHMNIKYISNDGNDIKYVIKLENPLR